MLTRRPPEQRLYPARSAFDWFFQDLWRDESNWQSAVPSVDLRETDDAFIVEAELPGLKPDDVEITVDGRSLVIRGESKTSTAHHDQQADKSSGRYLVQERRMTSFARALTLPTEIDAEHASSSFENGELMVKLPKAAQARSRRIPINGAREPRLVGSSSPDQDGQSSAAAAGRTRAAAQGSSER